LADITNAVLNSQDRATPEPPLTGPWNCSADDPDIRHMAADGDLT
jgi:hypothetical protein